MVLDADGAVELALGDVTAPVFPRSANKPMQAAGVLRAGRDLSGERLALAGASLPHVLDFARTGGTPMASPSTATWCRRCSTSTA
ncbi:hypothetical protein GCM10027074_41840 [Streptomyces deserti]